MKMTQIVGLILSAGYSRRMHEFKPLMKYEDHPFIYLITLKLSLVCQKVYLVLGYRAEDIMDELLLWMERKPSEAWLDRTGFKESDVIGLSRKVKFLINENYDDGMFSSLRAGLKSIPDSSWIFYHFIDQPHLPVSFYREIVTQIKPDRQWIQPGYQDTSGHPILMHPSLKRAILQADSSSNLKLVLKNNRITKSYWDCAYRQVLEDFDTPSDFYGTGELNEYL